MMKIHRRGFNSMKCSSVIYPHGYFVTKIRHIVLYAANKIY